MATRGRDSAGLHVLVTDHGLRLDDDHIKGILDLTRELYNRGGGPTLVDIVCQPLHEAKAPVSEWVA